MIGVLAEEEANLLHARSLARSNGWWDRVISTMQGLRQYYQHTGRAVEWSRLVEEVVPDFVNPATDGPLPGKEEGWSLVTYYRVLLAEDARQWDKAERLQSQRVSWDRQRVTPILAKPPQAWTADEKNDVRTLSSSLHEQSEIQRGQGSAMCVDGYLEALSLAEQIQETQGAATCAFNLGHAYGALLGIRDLALAERWYQRSLDRRAKEDRMGRAGCLGQLGSVAHERFLDARKTGPPPWSALVTSRRPNNTTGRRSKCSLRTPSQSLRLPTTNSGLSVPTRGRPPRPSVITANRSATVKACTTASVPLNHASTQRSHSPARATLPTPATGPNPPCAITKPAGMRTKKSPAPSPYWKRSNLVSERLHRRRKHIHADHIDQLDPKPECLHVGFHSLLVYGLERAVQRLPILWRKVLH